MKIKFGVSDISIMQIGKSIVECREDAIKAGWECFQSLPLKNNITGFESETICFEDVWRPELKHFWQVDPSRLFDDLLQLFVLFVKGDKREDILRNYFLRRIIHISHEYLDLAKNVHNTLVEISPNLGIVTLEKLSKICGDRQILVADTRHLIDYENSTGIKVENVIDVLGENLAPFIHFQPVIDVNSFIDIAKDDFESARARLRELVIFDYLLKVIKKNYENGLYGDTDLTIIVEYNPKFSFLSKNKSIKLSSNMLMVVKRLCEKMSF